VTAHGIGRQIIHEVRWTLTLGQEVIGQGTALQTFNALDRLAAAYAADGVTLAWRAVA
jgi:hypothetical protein